MQPIIGRIILPWFGGSASVWTTCLLFFQCALLAGYLYAHASVRFLQPSRQGLVHLVMLAVALLALPIVPDAPPPGSSAQPVVSILAVLALTVGLPYLLLSTTGPLVQAWLLQERPGSIPYRLFSLSNLGSMLALLTYPVLVEPFVATRLQGYAWSAAYAAYSIVVALIAWRVFRQTEAAMPLEASASRAHPKGHAIWIALATCPSIFLLALTNHLTQDVAPIPLLWIVPLALYLLSFVLCFERSGWYRRAWYLPLLAVALGAMTYVLIEGSDEMLEYIVTGFAAVFFIACMVCHGELARLKPDPRFLTEYYLMVATGGALGGLLVALVAPNVFDAYYELPVAIVATGLVVTWALVRRGSRLWLAAALLPLILGGFLADDAWSRRKSALVLVRNFYGTLKVSAHGEGEGRHLSLSHGAIEHGSQFVDPARHRWPTSYYGELSGVGILLRSLAVETSERVGVIGLGAGTLATYARPGDEYRFYEINPLVVAIARARFKYLADCEGRVETVLGDARLSLAREPAQDFDALVVDAFSGDSIPVHLLTREAFADYFRHLKPSGVLAVHTSNKHLTLEPVVKLAADQFGKRAVLVESDGDDEKAIDAASWVLVADKGHPIFARLADAGAEIAAKPGLRMWTDDYSSVFAVLK